MGFIIVGDVLSSLNIPRGFTFCLQVSCAGHMTFANSSDPIRPDGPDLGPNRLTFKISADDQNTMKKYSACKELIAPATHKGNC